MGGEKRGDFERTEDDEISLLEEDLKKLTVRSARIVPKDTPSLLCSVWTRKIFNPDSF